MICTFGFLFTFQLEWENRYDNAPNGTTTFVSLDGTDFRIMEPTEFSTRWYSHKFRGPGLRYEVGLCLDPGEKALADGGYRDSDYFENPNGDQQKKKILARHETVNGRIKQFSCMKNIFRHDLHLHPSFFHAVVHLTQLMIENGEPLYSVNP